MKKISISFSKSYPIFKIVVLTILLSISNFSFAQYSLNIKNDSIIRPAPLNITIEDIALSRLKKSETMFQNNQTIRSQNYAFTLINNEIQKANAILQRGFDYKGFTSEINLLIKWKNFAVDGITVNKNPRQTTRDLTTTTLLLSELESRTIAQINKIKNNNTALSDIQKNIDSLSSNKALYILPTDSIAKINYFHRLTLLNKDIDNTNISLKNAIDSIQSLEIKGFVFKNELNSDIVQVSLLRKIESDSLLSRRVSFFKAKDIMEKSFFAVLKHSLLKSYFVLKFYFLNNSAIINLLLIYIVGLYIFLKLLKRKYKKAEVSSQFKHNILIFKRPLATAILISIVIDQLFLPSPPFIFSSILWIIACISILFLVYENGSKLAINTWIIYFTLIVLVLIDNLILTQTIFETFVIISVAIITATFGIYRIFKKQKVFNTPTNWIVVKMVVFEISGLLFMLFGNYNFSKILISIGIITILIGYLTIYTFQLCSDIFNFTNQIIETDTSKENYNLAQENHKITKPVYLFYFISWVILINRNSYSFENYTKPITDAFSQEQTIGTFTYSYQSILVFFFIIIASVIITKIVSFLASEKTTNSITGEKKTNTGSWILLVRIAIISIGITFAFAITGIPTDRLTVIIGALGVGIGFGLQTLVNNLISGLIIAFEKPVNVDDIVEIGGHVGTMKSIGIRSSVVNTWDGADIIIPNGDLLNQHMTNWTMGSAKRRTEIKVGVAYGTDLKLAISIVQEVLEKHSLVLKNPEPFIWVTQFGDSSIDLVIKYWVPHFNYGNIVKSDLIIAIDDAFKLNNIVIPFPQQDIYIKSDPSLRTENKDENSEN